MPSACSANTIHSRFMHLLHAYTNGSFANGSAAFMQRNRQERPAFTLITDREPIREQMPRYTKMLLFPCWGATEKIKYRITAMAVVQ